MTKNSKTITVSRAKEALAGWDGMIEVSFHKIGDSATNSVAYDDIAYAVAYFNEIVTWYESGNFGGHMVILSKTWMEEPEDGYSRWSSWKSEPVIVSILPELRVLRRWPCSNRPCQSAGPSYRRGKHGPSDTIFTHSKNDRRRHEQQD